MRVYVETEGTIEQRTARFLAAFRALPGDKEIAVCTGDGYGEDFKFAAVVIDFGDDRLFGFTATEVRFVADVADKAREEYHLPEFEPFEALAAVLRGAADLAERDLAGTLQ